MFLTLTEEQRTVLESKQLDSERFVFADIGFCIASDNPAYISTLRRIYEAFIAPDLADITLTCYMLDSCEFTGRSCVIIDNVLYEFPRGDAFFGKAEIFVLQRVIDAIRSCFLLHAGVVAKDGNGYVIYAPTGFGKTTFVLRLVAEGFKFLSDEYCAIHSDSLMLQPFARRVGIKQNSPFLSLVQQRASDVLWCDGKYYVNCQDFFPGSFGETCRARYFLMLSHDLSDCFTEEGGHIVQIVFFDDLHDELHKLIRLVRGRIIRRTQQQYCTEYICELSRNRTVIGALHQFVKKHHHNIYFFAPVRKLKTDFSNTPQLLPMKKSEAAFEILSNIINRSPVSAFLSSQGGKHHALLMKIAAFLKDVECYRLVTGNLDAMAELVTAL